MSSPSPFESQYATRDQVLQLINHLQVGAGKIGALEALVVRIETSIGKLDVIVRGNGKPGVITQIELIRSDINRVERMVAEVKRAERKKETDKVADDAESERKKSGFLSTSTERVAIITALGAIVLAIIGLLKP